MYKSKFLALVALAILLGGVFVSAQAQKKTSAPIFTPPIFIGPPPTTLSGDYRMDVSANETSAGTIDFSSGSTYGWTCSGTTEGDLAGFVFISMDYSSDAGVASESRSGVKSVISGSWSKLIFVDGAYTGSVHGKIVGGQLVVNNVDGTTSMNLALIAEDGTGDYVGSTGSGTFVGTLAQNTRSRIVTGQLILNY